MSEILQITSNRGLVRFSKEDLIKFNLSRWIRTSFKGIGKRGLIQDGPFETVASKLYVEEYPQAQVHIAEKCILNMDGTVDVILRVGKQVSSEMYNQHNTQVVFTKKPEVTKVATIKQAASYYEGHIEQVIPHTDPQTGKTTYHVKNYSSPYENKQPLEISDEFDETIGVEDVDGDLVSIGDVVDILTDYVGYSGTTTQEGKFFSLEELSNFDEPAFLAYMKEIGLDDITSKEQFFEQVDPQEYLEYIRQLESTPTLVEPQEQSRDIIDKGIVRYWNLDADPEIKFLMTDLLKNDPELSNEHLETLVETLYQEELENIPSKTEKSRVKKNLIDEERNLLLEEKIEDILGNVDTTVPWAIVELLDPKTQQPTGKYVRVVHYELDKTKESSDVGSIHVYAATLYQKIYARRMEQLTRFSQLFETKVGAVSSPNASYEKESKDFVKGENLDITFPQKSDSSKESTESFVDVLKREINSTQKSADTENLSVTLVPNSQQAVRDQSYDESPTHDTSEQDVSSNEGKRQS